MQESLWWWQRNDRYIISLPPSPPPPPLINRMVSVDRLITMFTLEWDREWAQAHLPVYTAPEAPPPPPNTVARS